MTIEMFALSLIFNEKFANQIKSKIFYLKKRILLEICVFCIGVFYPATYVYAKGNTLSHIYFTKDTTKQSSALM